MLMGYAYVNPVSLVINVKKVNAKNIINGIFVHLVGRFVTYNISIISECNCNAGGTNANYCYNNGQCYCKDGFFNNRCEEGKCI